MLAASKLRGAGVEDVVSGEVFITVKNARVVLGSSLRVGRSDQTSIIDELCDLGLVESVNKRLIKIKK